MKLVVIESPYASPDPILKMRNRFYLDDAIRDCLRRGESPYASHLMLTSVLDDNIPEERARGISAGFEWARVCDLVAVYTDLGISKGMSLAISIHAAAGREISYRKLSE